MVDQEHVTILKSGTDEWNNWRRRNPKVRPDLSTDALKAIGRHERNQLMAEDLGTNFSPANPYYVSLRNIDLSHADLGFANLGGAGLFSVDLLCANLISARLRGTTIVNSDLSFSNLSHADFHSSRLDNVNLRECRMNGTFLSDNDLSQTSGLEAVIHRGESVISTKTLSRTLRSSGGSFTLEQLIFFENAGVPRTLLEYLPSILQTNPIEFYSCFLSYSTEDEAFAEKLNSDLKKANVKTWKWNLDAVPGRGLEANVDRGIRHYDKLILLCSVDSLESGAVEREIRRALEKEDDLRRAKAGAIKRAKDAKEPPPDIDTDIFVPIALDRYVFAWKHELAPVVRKQFIPDFSDTENDEDKYQKQLDRLIKALNPKAWG